MLNKIKAFFNSWVGIILTIIIIINFGVQSFRIPSGSMKDTLLVGDFLIAKKFTFGLSSPYIPFLEIPILPFYKDKIIKGREPKRGEIVIFRYPKDERKFFVKRCVALPEDKLFLKDKDLYIHMKEGYEYMKKTYPYSKIIKKYGIFWVKNPYKIKHKGIHNDPFIKREDSKMPMQLFDFMPISIEKGNYFMMGDNRDHSNDSRFWGSVPYKDLMGIPWFTTISIGEGFKLRTNRFFKFINSLEKKEILEKAIKERGMEKKLNQPLPKGSGFFPTK